MARRTRSKATDSKWPSRALIACPGCGRQRNVPAPFPGSFECKSCGRDIFWSDVKSGAQRFVDRNGPTKDEIDEIEYRMITAEMAPDDDTDALTRESLPPRADEEDDIPF
jgi:hypothetical protein